MRTKYELPSLHPRPEGRGCPTVAESTLVRVRANRSQVREESGRDGELWKVTYLSAASRIISRSRLCAPSPPERAWTNLERGKKGLTTTVHTSLSSPPATGGGEDVDGTSDVVSHPPGPSVLSMGPPFWSRAPVLLSNSPPLYVPGPWVRPSVTVGRKV